MARPYDRKRLTIRPYRPADREALVTLWQRCGLLVSYNDPDRDIALWQAAPNAEIFVGLTGERLAASVCIGHDGHRGNPYYVAVDPEDQGSGLGRRLMRHAESWLAELGVPKVNVMVRETNDEVIGFYKAIGYQETPRFVLARWLTADGEPPKPGPKTVAALDCTITYLEMTRKPKRAPVPPPHRLHVALLRAQAPPVGFYRYLYDSVGEDWLWYERRALDDEALAAILGDEAVEIYVLYAEGVPAGFAELDRRHEPDIELAYFGLLPEFIGCGLGNFLLGSAIDIAWGYEPRRFWVHTNTLDHPRALTLYQRHGFVPYRQETRTIEDPRLSGLVPVRPAQA